MKQKYLSINLKTDGLKRPINRQTFIKSNLKKKDAASGVRKSNVTADVGVILERREHHQLRPTYPRT